MLFGSRNGRKVTVYLRNDSTGHVIRTLCFDDGMAHEKRNAGAGNLGGMDAITAHPGRRINDSGYLTASLQQLEGYHKPHIAAAHHEDLFTGLNAVKIHHGLCGTCADDTREGPAFEGDHIFRSTCGNYDIVGFVVDNGVPIVEYHLFFLVDAHDLGVQQYLYACFFGFFQKRLPDAKAADFGLMFLGAEKLVNLFEELSAGSGVFIQYQRAHAAFCGLNGGGETCGSCANDNEFVAFHLMLLLWPDAVLRLNFHALF